MSHVAANTAALPHRSCLLMFSHPHRMRIAKLPSQPCLQCVRFCYMMLLLGTNRSCGCSIGASSRYHVCRSASERPVSSQRAIPFPYGGGKVKVVFPHSKSSRNYCQAGINLSHHVSSSKQRKGRPLNFRTLILHPFSIMHSVSCAGKVLAWRAAEA